MISTCHPLYWKALPTRRDFLMSVGTSHPRITYAWGHLEMILFLYFLFVTLVKMPNTEAHHDPLGYGCILHFSTLAGSLPESFRGKQFWPKNWMLKTTEVRDHAYQHSNYYSCFVFLLSFLSLTARHSEPAEFME